MEISVNTQRLIRFANHLMSVKNHPKMGEYKYAIFCSLMNDEKVEFATCFHAWIFDDLPILFKKDWYFNTQRDEPFKIGMSEEEGSIGDVFDFFDLAPNEFCHLFDVDGFQNPYYYGGSYLTPKSEGKQIAENILQFISHKELLNHHNPQLN